MKDPALELLSATYGIYTSYPWYGGWKYDRQDAGDPFIQSLVSDLEHSPQTLHLLREMNASIYVCKHLGRTHVKGRVWYGNAASSPAICDPFRREILIGREYYPEGRIPVQTKAPGFVVAHELAHVLDTALGKYTDPYGEDPPEPTTYVDFYAKSALNLDMMTNPDMQSQFKVRSGLLGGEDGHRSSATEIICDLIAHAWSGHEPATYRNLATRYPALEDVAKTMRLAATSPAHITLYRKMANRFENLPRISDALKTLESAPPTSFDGPVSSRP
jgi:hypothetical protein